jgi:hypothetical protein
MALESTQRLTETIHKGNISLFSVFTETTTKLIAGPSPRLPGSDPGLVCEICDEKRGNGQCSPRISVVSCQYHSTSVPPFLHGLINTASLKTYGISNDVQ